MNDGPGSGDGGFDRRRIDYLAAAVTVDHPSSLLNALDHLEWRRRGGSDPAAFWAGIDDAVIDHWCRRIDAWRDCADFDMLRLLVLWLDDGDAMPPELRRSVRRRILDFSYWYTDPRPDGVVDHRWYWSENHRLIFHACELLAGAAFADSTFVRTGWTGHRHRVRAAQRLGAWFDEKAVDGFSEWHSDTYYAKDLAALLVLAEHADEPISDRAAAGCDLVLLDLALHQLDGNVGSTHGRSYMRHKARAATQPVAAALSICFGVGARPDGTWDWPLDDGDDVDLLPLGECATLLARARRYRPPAAIVAVATDATEMVDRETMGIEIDSAPPVGPLPARSDGRRYDDAALVPYWWDRGALTPWPLVPLLLDTLDRHDLWGADLFEPFRAMRGVLGDDPTTWQQVAGDLHRVVNAGLLERVTTVTWRNRHAMLSTAQDYRPGCVGFQHHVSQATLRDDAIVFVTHAGNPPTAQRGDYLDGDRYWTGSATLPRAVQHGRCCVQVYAPGFTLPDMAELAGFAYAPETHAFFPTDRFDEVVERDGWVIGRKGDGYVGLWSWRLARWRDHDPATTYTDGLAGPFDLVAAGGPDNVWICEVGDAGRWNSFAAFCEALATASVEVVDAGWGDDGAHRGFDVTYHSPAEGLVEVGWTGGLAVAGVDAPISGGPRFDNPCCRVADDGTITIDAGGHRHSIDLAAGRPL